MDDDIEDAFCGSFFGSYGEEENHRPLKFTEHERIVLIHEYGFVIGTSSNVDCACHVLYNPKRSIYIVPSGSSGMFSLSITYSDNTNISGENEPISFHTLLSTLSDIITL